MATRSRKLTGSAGALLGYFEELRLRGLESYYSPPSRNGHGEHDDVVFDEVWGKAAERLGVDKLTRAQFTELAEGRWDGKKLVGSGYRKVIDKETGEARTERVRTTMIDVVFAAPKSVMEFLIAIDDEKLRADVIAAFKESVRAGFNSMEAHAAVARVPVETPTERGRATVQHGRRAGQESKMQGSRTMRVTAELIGLPVIQFSARPTDATVDRGSPPDPHLHAHVPIIAVCWVPDDIDPTLAKTYTPDEQGIRATAAEREAVWMGEFARRLEELGIPLEYSTTRKGTITWEIAGSNPLVRRFFSTNGERAHALKLQFERQYGRSPTNGELTALCDMTRRRKDADAKQVDQRGAWDRWRGDVKRAGLKLTAPKIKRDRVRRESREQREGRLAARLFDGTGVTRDDSVFTRDTLRATIARCAVGLGFDRDELTRLEDSVLREIIPIEQARDSRFDLFTTTHVIEAELAIAAAIEEKAHDVLPAPSPGAIWRAMAKSRIELDGEQRAAVELMCSPQAWVTLQGHAGTGKTATLQAVVAAYRDRRYGRAAANTVIVLSTAAAVAERTGRPLEADRTSSIDSLVASVRAGAREPDARTLILVDEAAMVDTPRMAALLEVAGDARIICIGDPAQLVPIGPGGWYADAAVRHGVHELLRVYRQRDEADVRDYTRVRDGAAAQALASLEERGRVHIADERSRAVELAVAMYRDHLNAGQIANDVVVVLDGSNHEVDTVNRLAQRERELRGEITGPGYEVRSTETERRWTVHPEDIVIFLETYYRQPPDKRLPPGEKRQRRVNNGETGVIVDIDHKRNLAVVSMDRGDVVTVELTKEIERQPLGLAYGLHVAKYQGGEAPFVIVLPSASPIASQNSGYTQLTRGSVEAHVIVDYETHGDTPVEQLAKAWSQPASKRTAVSYLDPEVVAHARAAAHSRAAHRAAERKATRRDEPAAEAAPTNGGPPRAPTREEEPVAEPKPVPQPTRAPPSPQGSPHDDRPLGWAAEPEIVESETDELLVDSVDLYHATESQWRRADPLAEPVRDARADIEAASAHLDEEPQEGPPEPALDPDEVGNTVTSQEERDATVPEVPGRGASPAGPHTRSGAGTAEAQRKRKADRETALAQLRARRAASRGRNDRRGDDADLRSDPAPQRDAELKNVLHAPPEQRPYRDAGMGHVEP